MYASTRCLIPPPPPPRATAPSKKKEKALPAPFVGHRLGGRFLLTKLLGQGSMAQVYLAKDSQGGEVAVKVLRMHCDPAHARLQAEAEALTALDGQGAPRLIAFDPDVPYLVMALLPGRTLADRLARGPLKPQEAAALLEGLAKELDAIHARGYVHGDLKPGNVILTPDGPRVIDFGLCHRVDQMGLRGKVAGTVGYIAPECFTRAGGDTRVDVFAVGAILYRALVGKKPCRAANLAELVRTRDFAPMPRLPAHLGAVDAVLRQALRTAPGGRFRSVGAFSQAFRLCAAV